MPREDSIWKGLDINQADDQRGNGFFIEFLNIDIRRLNIARPRVGLDRVVPTTFESTESVVLSGAMVDGFDASGETAGAYSKMNRSIGDTIALSGLDSDVFASGAFIGTSGTPTSYVASGAQTDPVFSNIASGDNPSGEFSKFNRITASGYDDGDVSYQTSYACFDGDGDGWAVGSLSGEFPSDTGTLSVHWCAGYEFDSGSGSMHQDQWASAEWSLNTFTPLKAGNEVGPAVRVCPWEGDNPGSGYGMFGLTSAGRIQWRLYAVSGWKVKQSAISAPYQSVPESGTEIKVTAEDHASGVMVYGYVSGVQVVDKLFTTLQIGSGVPGIYGGLKTTSNDTNKNSWNKITNFKGGSMVTNLGTNGMSQLCGGAHEHDSGSGTMEDDQYAQLVVSGHIPFLPTVNGGDAAFGPAVRITEDIGATSGSCYWVGAYRHTAANLGQITLHKVASGINSVLTSVDATIPTGDFTLKILVQGTAITGYLDGANVVSTTDTAITSGTPGIVGHAKLCGTPFDGSGMVSSYRGDSFVAGGLTATAGGALGDLAADAYVAAIASFEPFGEESYFYADASGSLRLMKFPTRAT